VRSAFPDQFGRCISPLCELPSRSEQSARQLAATGDNADRDLLFAFHRLPVQAVAGLDAQSPPDFCRDA
jgi:hypothetical protein